MKDAVGFTFLCILALIHSSATATTRKLPTQIVVSKDAHFWRKSLTVYDADCNQIGKIKKKCESFHNDVEVQFGGEKVSSSNYHVRWSKNTLDVYDSTHQSGITPVCCQKLLIMLQMQRITSNYV